MLCIDAAILMNNFFSAGCNCEFLSLLEFCLLLTAANHFSGGMSVTVIGTNLNTIQQPQIVAHFRDELSFVEVCFIFLSIRMG